MILPIERIYHKIIHHLSFLSFGDLNNFITSTFPMLTVCRGNLSSGNVTIDNSYCFLGDVCGYRLLIMAFIIVISAKISQLMLQHIPKKYLNKDGIRIGYKWLVLIYFPLLIFNFSLNDELIIVILFSIFFNLIVCLFIIDMKIGYLPDILVYPLLWVGLVYQVCSEQGNVVSAIYAVITSYLSIMLLTVIMEKIRQSPQMGRGDFKLIAACAAWLGLMNLPQFFALAAGIGGLHYWAIYLRHRHKAIARIPFGPAIILSATYWLFAPLVCLVMFNGAMS
ncbi:prepilin peptidase [Providencia stuartii]|uniref:prepilin peptidase n=1 Tax=Providencia stuartii TaxID=588 RepID=UPI000A7409D4|nr:A24 family peptidase [Providencia stuartii]